MLSTRALIPQQGSQFLEGFLREPFVECPVFQSYEGGVWYKPESMLGALTSEPQNVVFLQAGHETEILSPKILRPSLETGVFPPALSSSSMPHRGNHSFLF